MPEPKPEPLSAAELAELDVEPLERFVRHDEYCPATGAQGRCICGLQEALAAAAAPAGSLDAIYLEVETLLSKMPVPDWMTGGNNNWRLEVIEECHDGWRAAAILQLDVGIEVREVHGESMYDALVALSEVLRTE
jgi:hypothetical protein